MRVDAGTLLAAPAAGAHAAPRWIRSCIAGVSPQESEQHGWSVSQWRLRSAVFSRLRLPDARQLDAAAFEAAVSRGYRVVRQPLATPHHVVRCWNYLPGICEPMDERRDRYMAFNGGRFAALSAAAAWWAHLPAASAVGHGGDDLQIDVLSVASPGVSIENTRQIPASRYSAAYGPRPPCFARGCRIAAGLLNRPALLVSGTASIRGEATVHPDSLGLQVRETWLNLQHLLSSVAAGPFTAIRVYHPNPLDRTEIETFLSEQLDGEVDVEFVTADLCRTDLLVEIEAVAAIGPAPGETRERR